MEKGKQIFNKMGAFLVDHLKLDQSEKGKHGLQQELDSLRADGSETVRDYYIRKASFLLMILAAGIILSAVCFFCYRGEEERIRNQTIARPGYGEGDRTEELAVQVEGEEEVKEYEVRVQARKYTESEKQELTDRAIEELEALLPGENESLDEVRNDLILPESMENGAVKISWLTIPYGVIGETGEILKSEDENGVLVEIQGTLTCENKETVYTTYAKVFPKELPEEEQFYQSVSREVARADADDSHEATLKLPEQVDGKKLTWLRQQENPFLSLFALTLLAAVCVYIQMDNQVHQRAEKRKNQLMLDYPDLMWKMTMLLGAGLSIKGTFFRISEQYQKEKTAGPEKQQNKKVSGKMSKSRTRYVYEEITYACREMNSGIPEAEAYERFGRRCQLPEYIRLGSVLAQNLKKGARGLTALLETEAAASLNDRKNHARRISERAGTKLLLPMILMLGIVLVILMVPAFLSF